MDKVRDLLDALKADEYVRFKYGKALDAAVKAFESQQAVPQQELESRLVELLELVRGKKGASAPPRSKSKPAKKVSAAAPA